MKDFLLFFFLYGLQKYVTFYPGIGQYVLYRPYPAMDKGTAVLEANILRK